MKFHPERREPFTASPPELPAEFEVSAGSGPTELRQASLQALLINQPALKCEAVRQLRGAVALNTAAVLPAPAKLPGRPACPELVSPNQVPRRSMASKEGRACLLHALAHIEFNAINLALDIIWRFPGMPESFYRDWYKVAHEEVDHFSMLDRRLKELGFSYGDFPAHNGLWEMAEKTGGDILARIALVPRTLEARGLDVSPAIRQRLVQAGDTQSAGLLDIILRDEVGHVAIGNHWYKWLCERRGLEPVATYEELSRQYRAPKLRGPFNLDARRQAGFDERELASLQRMAGETGA